MNFCGACGTKQLSGSAFCHSCGFTVITSDETTGEGAAKSSVQSEFDPDSTVSPSPSQTVPTRPGMPTESLRRNDTTYQDYVFDGETHRCPKCNASLIVGMKRCSSCGVSFMVAVPHLPRKISAEASTSSRRQNSNPNSPKRRKPLWVRILGLLATVVVAYIAFAVWVWEYRLSGIYVDDSHTIRLIFAFDGVRFDSAYGDGKPVMGSYTRSGSHFTIDFSSGKAGADPQLATNPIYTAITQALGGDVSDDQQTVTFGGVPLHKQD